MRAPLVSLCVKTHISSTKKKRIRIAMIAGSIVTAILLSSLPLGSSSALQAAVPGGSIEVWWPTDSASISGTQPFKALLQGKDIKTYSMYWKVDNRASNRMYNSWQDYPHKEAIVNVSGWNWRGNGPYKITFIAKDSRQKILGTRSINVNIQGSTSVTSSSSSRSSQASVAPTTVSTPLPTTPTQSSSSLASVAPITQSKSSSSVAVAPMPVSNFGNPFRGATLYVDPNSNAKRQADTWRSTRPADAALMQKIADQSQAMWLGNWNPNISADAKAATDRMSSNGSVPVFIAYNVPQRDCGGYSAGGSGSPEAYRSWIQGLADGIGTRRAVVILEPDALSGMGCLSSADQETRVQLLRDAVRTLKSKGSIAVYVDAGHSSWIAADDMAGRLKRAGIDGADGFSLNISNFRSDAETIGYGTTVSKLTSGKHFVFDTSRNGNGPSPDNQWCNPSGRALGRKSSVSTGQELIDAFLWLKDPGASDGQCNGGPAAGVWWPEYALGLAQRAGW